MGQSATTCKQLMTNNILFGPYFKSESNEMNIKHTHHLIHLFTKDLLNRLEPIAQMG